MDKVGMAGERAKLHNGIPRAIHNANSLFQDWTGAVPIHLPHRPTAYPGILCAIPEDFNGVPTAPTGGVWDEEQEETASGKEGIEDVKRRAARRGEAGEAAERMAADQVTFRSNGRHFSSDYASAIPLSSALAPLDIFEKKIAPF